MEATIDFLSFRTFISPHALLVFYYLGAIGMPLVAWATFAWLRRRYPRAGQLISSGREFAWSTTGLRQRVLLIGMFLGSFLIMELLWRMMFEFLFAFLQMRDALVFPQDHPIP